MKECGKEDLSMVVGSIFGKMELCLRDTFGWENEKEKELPSFRMALASRPIGETTYASKTISFTNTNSRASSVKFDIYITLYSYENSFLFLFNEPCQLLIGLCVQSLPQQLLLLLLYDSIFIAKFSLF